MSKFTEPTRAPPYIVERGRGGRDAGRVREETRRSRHRRMQIAPTGRADEMLARLIGAAGDQVGTFTGFRRSASPAASPRAASCLLRARPRAGGDGLANFERAGVADPIEIRVGPAGETLEASAASRRPLRLRLHRRGQARLRQLLRGCLGLLRPAGSDPARQRPAGRGGARSARAESRGRSTSSTARSPTTSASTWR